MIAAAASVLLGVTFLIAGASKLAAGRAWPGQASSMGIAAPIAVAVPWIEIVVGAALVARLAAPVPAIAAIVALVAFTVLVAIRLADGDHPPCACFGGWSTRPLGARHLVRNVALLALGVIALWA